MARFMFQENHFEHYVENRLEPGKIGGTETSQETVREFPEIGDGGREEVGKWADRYRGCSGGGMEF